jgi:arabinogalactan oligomer/maltooligosaccharide transport system permease protein
MNALKVLLPALVLAWTFLGGCVRRVEPDLVVWHAYRGAEATVLNELARQWGESEGVVVEVVPIPYQAFANKLTASIPRGNGPDLFIAAHEQAGGWFGSGLIAALPAASQAWVEGLPENYAGACQRDGVTLCVPLSVKNVALFYNPVLLREAGFEVADTLEELVRQAGDWTAPGEGRYGLVYQAADFYFHAPFLYAFGGSLTDASGAPQLASPEMSLSLAFVFGIAGPDGILPRDVDYNVVRDRFSTGNALYAINGPWFAGELGEMEEFGVVPLPTLATSGLAMRPLLTVESAFVSAHVAPANQGLAEQLALFLASPEAAAARAEQGGQVPALQPELTSGILQALPIARAFSEAALNGVPMSNDPRMRALWEPANRLLARTLRGEDHSDSLAQAQADLQLALSPPPAASDPTPWIVFAGIAFFVGVILWVRRARQSRLVERVVAHRTAYAFIAPAAIASFGLLFVPFAIGASISLFAHEQGRFTFVGLSNFIRILFAGDYAITEPRNFWYTLVVTVFWTAANVFLHVTIGLWLAMMLRDPWVKLRGIYRALLIIPWAVPNYITALVWKSLFNFNFGAINRILATVGAEPVDWFSSFSTAFTANLVTNTWLGFPFMMVVSLGALQSIPRDLEDAAEVDGASRWQRFRHITLPLLAPALVPAIILGSVWTFNMFNVIYLVSGGAPDSRTDILITEAYRWAFQRQEQYGYAAAYGCLIFLVLLFWNWLTERAQKARREA